MLFAISCRNGFLYNLLVGVIIPQILYVLLMQNCVVFINSIDAGQIIHINEIHT
jgi:hypothetical protein